MVGWQPLVAEFEVAHNLTQYSTATGRQSGRREEITESECDADGMCREGESYCSPEHRVAVDLDTNLPRNQQIPTEDSRIPKEEGGGREK
jgi:hypothetical protein